MDPIHQVFYGQLPMLSCPKTATLKNDTEFPRREYTFNPKEAGTFKVVRYEHKAVLMMGTTLTMLRIMTQRDSKSGDPPPTPSVTIDFYQPSMTAAHTSTLLTIDCGLNLLPNVPSEQQPCSQVQQRSEVDLLFRISEQHRNMVDRRN